MSQIDVRVVFSTAGALSLQRGADNVYRLANAVAQFPRTGAGLSRALGVIERDMNRFTSVARGMSNVISTELYKAFNRVYGIASGFASISFAAFGVQLAGTAILLRRMAKDFIEVNEKFADLEITMRSAFGSVSVARKLRNEIVAFTARSPLPFSAIADSARAQAIVPPLNARIAGQAANNTLGDENGTFLRYLRLVEQLTTFRPDRSAEDANFSLREALAGNLRSIQRRFDISPYLFSESSGRSQAYLKQNPDAMLEAIQGTMDRIISPQAIREIVRQPSKLFQNLVEQLRDIPLLKTGDAGIYKSFNDLLFNIFEDVTASIQNRGDTYAKKFSAALEAVLKSVVSSTSSVTERLLSSFKLDSVSMPGLNLLERLMLGASKAADALAEKLPAAISYIERFASTALPALLKLTEAMANLVGYFAESFNESPLLTALQALFLIQLPRMVRLGLKSAGEGIVREAQRQRLATLNRLGGFGSGITPLTPNAGPANPMAYSTGAAFGPSPRFVGATMNLVPAAQRNMMAQNAARAAANQAAIQAAGITNPQSPYTNLIPQQPLFGPAGFIGPRGRFGGSTGAQAPRVFSMPTGFTARPIPVPSAGFAARFGASLSGAGVAAAAASAPLRAGASAIGGFLMSSVIPALATGAVVAALGGIAHKIFKDLESMENRKLDLARGGDKEFKGETSAAFRSQFDSFGDYLRRAQPAIEKLNGDLRTGAIQAPLLRGNLSQTRGVEPVPSFATVGGRVIPTGTIAGSELRPNLGQIDALKFLEERQAAIQDYITLQGSLAVGREEDLKKPITLKSTFGTGKAAVVEGVEAVRTLRDTLAEYIKATGNDAKSAASVAQQILSIFGVKPLDQFVSLDLRAEFNKYMDAVKDLQSGARLLEENEKDTVFAKRIQGLREIRTQLQGLKSSGFTPDAVAGVEEYFTGISRGLNPLETVFDSRDEFLKSFGNITKLKTAFEEAIANLEFQSTDSSTYNTAKEGMDRLLNGEFGDDLKRLNEDLFKKVVESFGKGGGIQAMRQALQIDFAKAVKDRLQTPVLKTFETANEALPEIASADSPTKLAEALRPTLAFVKNLQDTLKAYGAAETDSMGASLRSLASQPLDETGVLGPDRMKKRVESYVLGLTQLSAEVETAFLAETDPAVASALEGITEKMQMAVKDATRAAGLYFGNLSEEAQKAKFAFEAQAAQSGNFTNPVTNSAASAYFNRFGMQGRYDTISTTAGSGKGGEVVFNRFVAQLQLAELSLESVKAKFWGVSEGTETYLMKQRDLAEATDRVVEAQVNLRAAFESSAVSFLSGQNNRNNPAASALFDRASGNLGSLYSAAGLTPSASLMNRLGGPQFGAAGALNNVEMLRESEREALKLAEAFQRLADNGGPLAETNYNTAESLLKLADAQRIAREQIEGRGGMLGSFSDGFTKVFGDYYAQAQNFSNIGTQMAETLTNNLGTALTNIAMQTEEAGEAFKNFGKAVLQTATQMLMQKAVQMALGFVFSGFGAGGFAAGFAGSAVGSAAGGAVGGGLSSGGTMFNPSDFSVSYGGKLKAPPVGGSKSVTAPVNVTVNVAKNGSTSLETSEGAEQLGKGIQAVVNQNILESSRQGGIVKRATGRK